MGRTAQPFVSAKIGSRPQNKSRWDDAAVPAVSSRTSFARCSNFLLAPLSKTFRVTRPSSLTVLRLAASGYRAVVGHSEGGPMGPRNLSSARLVLWILVWVAMSKRRRVRVHIIRELFKTLLAVSWMTRSIPRPIGAS